MPIDPLWAMPQVRSSHIASGYATRPCQRRCLAPGRQIKLLSDYRRDLVMQRTPACCQLRCHPHELDPDLTLPSRRPRSASANPAMRPTQASMIHGGDVGLSPAAMP